MSQNVKLTEASFRNSLVKFVVSSNQPFSIVENKEFEDLVQLISKNPEATKLPGRTAMTTYVPERYNNCKGAFINYLTSLNSKISLVIDCWTSSNQLAFQGVIIRYIDAEWNLQTISLDLSLLSGCYSGENIAHALLPVAENFGILDKILSITTDNASNMDSFFYNFTKLMESKGQVFDVVNQRVRCLAHILNLCAKDAIAEFENGNMLRLIQQIKIHQHYLFSFLQAAS